MSDTITLETLASEIRQRLDALGEDIPTDDQLAGKIRDELSAFIASDEGVEAVRKLKFGAEDDPKLKGTKYARLGMSVADLELLHELQEGLRGQKRVGDAGVYQGPSEELATTVKAVSESRRVPTMVARAEDERRLEELRAAGVLTGKRYAQAAAAVEQVYAAMDTAESGYGSELVGAQYVRSLWTGAQAESRVFGLIPQFDMTDPTAYLPVEADLPELLFVGESTANNSSNYDTVKTGSQRVQVDAKKFVMHQMWSGEMEEDSLIPFLPFIRGQQARGLAHYSDSLVLNGDTTNAATGNINLDDADPADTKHYLAFDGIRHAALVDNTANGTSQGAAVTYAALLNLRSLMIDRTYMHDWGHPSDPNDLVYVITPELVDTISGLDQVITVDKYGAQATVLTGEVAKIGRHSLVSSIALSRTEADGKVSTTGGNNTKDQAVAFNRRGFVAGIRRRARVETERLPATDQTRIVVSARMGLGRFSPTGAASGIESAAVLYNIG